MGTATTMTVVAAEGGEAGRVGGAQWQLGASGPAMTVATAVGVAAIGPSPPALAPVLRSAGWAARASGLGWPHPPPGAAVGGRTAHCCVRCADTAGCGQHGTARGATSLLHCLTALLPARLPLIDPGGCCDAAPAPACSSYCSSSSEGTAGPQKSGMVVSGTGTPLAV